MENLTVEFLAPLAPMQFPHLCYRALKTLANLSSLNFCFFSSARVLHTVLCPGRAVSLHHDPESAPREKARVSMGFPLLCFLSLKVRNLILPIVQFTVQLPVVSFILSSFTVVYGGSGGNLVISYSIGNIIKIPSFSR